MDRRASESTRRPPDQWAWPTARATDRATDSRMSLFVGIDAKQFLNGIFGWSARAGSGMQLRLLLTLGTQETILMTRK